MTGKRQPNPELESIPGDVTEETLHERFRRRVVFLATRRMGSSTDAQDVAQETLKRVLEALREGRVRDMEALPAFVYQTARHICQHWHRKSGRESRALERFARENRTENPGSAALTKLIGAERCSAVRVAIEHLDESDRSLLTAIYYEETDVHELAKRLSLTLGALRVRKHRALKRLGALLERNAEARRGT